jgi:hypothetical protein
MTMPSLANAVDFGDVAAWGVIVGTFVYAMADQRHYRVGSAVALAALAALVIKSALMPLT